MKTECELVAELVKQIVDDQLKTREVLNACYDRCRAWIQYG